jgi:hypothetical protein
MTIPAWSNRAIISASDARAVEHLWNSDGFNCEEGSSNASRRK